MWHACLPSWSSLEANHKSRGHVRLPSPLVAHHCHVILPGCEAAQPQIAPERSGVDTRLQEAAIEPAGEACQCRAVTSSTRQELQTGQALAETLSGVHRTLHWVHLEVVQSPHSPESDFWLVGVEVMGTQACDSLDARRVCHQRRLQECGRCGDIADARLRD